MVRANFKLERPIESFHNKDIDVGSSGKVRSGKACRASVHGLHGIHDDQFGTPTLRLNISLNICPFDMIQISLGHFHSYLQDTPFKFSN